MTEQTIDQFLEENEKKDLLRFSTAGSIDDGKSTLIGRLLHDSKNVYEDQLAAIKDASTEKASDENIDFALMTDGLKAEREQGITIDVAYRYFSTPRRKFIIADSPGHEQYTRNMATGASTADLSIVLVDARHGILAQTKRHAFIASLLGVPHLVVAVNKMDLVDYDQTAFEAIKHEFEAFAQKLNAVDVRFIPISALKGDNVVDRSKHTPWYEGESLLELLESIYIGSDRNLIDLRFPVQYVVRPHMDFRGYAGEVASGIIRVGDEVLAVPSMRQSRVKSIVTYAGEQEEAFPPMSVVVTLEDELDVSRGDMLVHVNNLPHVERRVEAMLVWMGDDPMDLSRPYFIKHTTQSTRARIDEVRYRVDVNSLDRLPSQALQLNEIARVVITSHKALHWDPYTQNRASGSFILVDSESNATVAAGMIVERRAAADIDHGDDDTQGLVHRESRVSAAEHAERLGQRGATLWLTGLVGSGKTAIAFALEKRLFDLGATSVVLDGENIRLGLSRHLDFSPEGRLEHLRRVAELARITNDHGIIAICGFVSPTEAVRRQVGEIVGPDRFTVVHVAAPVAWCEDRDESGLYEKARTGEATNVAGVSSVYEPPEDPALTLDVTQVSTEQAVDQIVAMLRERNLFPYRA